jgi:hypothetical protein
MPTATLTPTPKLTPTPVVIVVTATPEPIAATATSVVVVEVAATPVPPPGLLTGIPVPSGATVKKGTALICREIRWDLNPVEVWVWYGIAESDLFVGPNFDSQSAQHVRDAWISSDLNTWASMGAEACKEAQAVEAGGLGVTNVKVHFQGDNPPPDVCPQ